MVTFNILVRVILIRFFVQNVGWSIILVSGQFSWSYLAIFWAIILIEMDELSAIEDASSEVPQAFVDAKSKYFLFAAQLSRFYFLFY